MQADRGVKSPMPALRLGVVAPRARLLGEARFTTPSATRQLRPHAGGPGDVLDAPTGPIGDRLAAPDVLAVVLAIGMLHLGAVAASLVPGGTIFHGPALRIRASAPLAWPNRQARAAWRQSGRKPRRRHGRRHR